MDGEFSNSQLLMTAIGTMASVIVILWKQQQNRINELKAASDECQKDRQKLWLDREQLVIRIAALEAECRVLKRRAEGDRGAGHQNGATDDP